MAMSIAVAMHEWQKVEMGPLDAPIRKKYAMPPCSVGLSNWMQCYCMASPMGQMVFTETVWDGG